MSSLRVARRLFCPWLLCVASVAASSEHPMAAPDSVGSYQGSANARPILGSVDVKEPPIGYFVAGSSLLELNGPYGRLRVADMAFPSDWSSKVQLAYENLRSGWQLMKMAAPEAAERGPDDNGLEWAFVDSNWTLRFVSENASAVCMSGLEFRHHQDATPSEVVSVADELPWQVTAVLTSNAMDKILAGLQVHEESIQATIAGKGLPHLPDVQGGQALEGEDPPDVVWEEALRSAGVDANVVCTSDNAAVVESVLAALELTANDAPWSSAQVHLAVARCSRRNRNFTAAESSVKAALETKPRYKEALFEKGLLLMDAGFRYGEAIRAFQTLLRVDRAWPGLDMWLVRAHGQVRRREQAKRMPILVKPGEEPPEDCTEEWCGEDYYLALGVRWDVPSTEADGSVSKELKKAYKQRSLELHPDRSPVGERPSEASASRAFKQVAEVFATLSNAERRAAYDACEDIARIKQKDGTLTATHKVLVERKYFPERYGFEPFGDPLQDRHTQEYAAAAKRERSRQDGLAAEVAESGQAQEGEKRDEL